ncbi:MAG: polymer-forming cytoskeletal protein [Alphaproteobacteria bacterium]
MSVEKKTIRSDIPGHSNLLGGTIAYAGSTQEESRRLVVGRDISLQGDIGCCDHLVVEGTVNAQGFSARRMDILEAGFYAGSAIVQDAVIAGRFEGKITVSGRLTVKSTGRLYGEIEYGTIECEAGARIEGQMTVLTPAVAEQPVVTAPEVNDNSNVENLFDGSEEESTEERPRVFRRAVGY